MALFKDLEIIGIIGVVITDYIPIWLFSVNFYIRFLSQLHNHFNTLVEFAIKMGYHV